jgi:hypothetical protein
MSGKYQSLSSTSNTSKNSLPEITKEVLQLFTLENTQNMISQNLYLFYLLKKSLVLRMNYFIYFWQKLKMQNSCNYVLCFAYSLIVYSKSSPVRGLVLKLVWKRGHASLRCGELLEFPGDLALTQHLHMSCKMRYFLVNWWETKQIFKKG